MFDSGQNEPPPAATLGGPGLATFHPASIFEPGKAAGMIASGFFMPRGEIIER
ncbi:MULTISPECIES: hypothetical protein [unclassified Bradyrhizobium]|uniref:hypothetical protein n=1 Tax=unclassified Bradyrhizobium TaxID=2631580 RepID=UPI00247A6D86|nr:MULTISPECIES: hypothetical protein [unclassified Bradyrhizobium]WGR67810.1 hypothetical protein MTX24_20285 [Bradyrhizobium sp. ISRA426]WGR79863.1 hypothetical protein MTX21_05400 [Bradyrhizobium sp. ISRA430]WGR83049.1 hypothetical protein MTX25_19965 [Bradyrhizobium sp. ISRA432]